MIDGPLATFPPGASARTAPGCSAPRSAQPAARRGHRLRRKSRRCSWCHIAPAPGQRPRPIRQTSTSPASPLATVQARTYGRGCRICSRKAGSSRPPKPGTSLADKRPDVVADWNWDRNSDITPDQVGVNSARKVWWRCGDCGHEWSAPIKIRVRSRTHRWGICPRRSRKTPGVLTRDSSARKAV
ncbi:hypothetical protein Rwratislav_01822 [Rhodococcus wratislaviensis IFP 2016]|nr:hypothetical protein Rwratislav_01822 [Rhodococcus wratislaviensis IFP 2016]